ncbi:MAG: hypothetical protein IKP51_10615 [Treponema sp.]|nr:hypothetical protein [Treponema sp.]
MSIFKTKNFLALLGTCILLASCVTNKDFVAMPEWARLAAESDLGGDFFELKWTDENGQEVTSAENFDGDGAKLNFEAKAENLPDGKEVFAYIYRSNAKDKDDFVQKVLCKVKDGKVFGHVLMKEPNEFLETLFENDKLAYFFVLGPQISKPVKIDFTFIITIWNNPYGDVHDSSYVLEDKNGGKKYSQRKFCDADMIPVDESHYYLKFTNVKPGLMYHIRYCLSGKNYGQVIYDNLSFVNLMED